MVVREEAIAYRSRNICAVKAKSRLSPDSQTGVCSIDKRRRYEKSAAHRSRTSQGDLLIAFAIGLGIAEHPVFFLAALLIAVVVLAEAIINATGQLKHRHP